MTDEQFNLITDMKVYEEKNKYTKEDINILEDILFNIKGESYKVRGCAACLYNLKNKIYPYYIKKKQQIDAEKKTTAVRTGAKRKSTRQKKGSSK